MVVRRSITSLSITAALLALLPGLCGDAGGSTTAANPSLAFRGPMGYELPGQPNVMAVADVNGDGRSDVVVGTGFGGDETTLFVAGPGGRFSATRTLHIEDTHTIAGGVAIGDLNGDGNQDIVRVFLKGLALNGPAPTTLLVMFGDGRGGFPTKLVRRVRCCGWDVTVADFNGDRHNDVAVRGIGVFLGNGSGWLPTLRPGSLGDSPPDPSESIVAADLNRDRRLDLVVLNGSEEAADPAHIQLGRGNGRFDGPELLPVGDVASLAVGKFNRDRWPDLAALVNEDGFSWDLRVLLGTRSGKPRPTKRRYLAGKQQLRDVEAADVDRDGNTDLVVTGSVNSEGGNLRILLGTGRGFFRRPIEVARCCNSWLTEIGHFNRDRKPDIAATSRGGTADNLSILFNETRRSRG
jgi:hypothetical protein